MSNRIDLLGQVFGKLTVVSYAGLLMSRLKWDKNSRSKPNLINPQLPIYRLE